MSLQDSIFDVRAALEGKPEQVLFDEIVQQMTIFEVERDLLRKDLLVVNAFRELLNRSEP